LRIKARRREGKKIVKSSRKRVESAVSRGKVEPRLVEMTRGKTEKTTEKREEQAFIAGRTAIPHHRLQLKGGGGWGKIIVTTWVSL
jgi:hypothetical protein